MAKKWGKCLVNKPGKYPDELKGKVGSASNPVPGVKATHLITATDKVLPGYFYVDTTSSANKIRVIFLFLLPGQPRVPWCRSAGIQS